MQFITGQLAAVKKSLLGEAQTLEAKMATMQAERMGAMEASKTSLARAEKELDYQRGQVSSYYEQQEEARQFDVETGLAYQKELQDAMQFEQKLQLDYQKEIAGQELDYAKLQQKEQADLRAYNLSEAKYNEDVRQYGLDYAQKNRQIAISASKEARLGSESGTDDKLSATAEKNKMRLELDEGIRNKMAVYNTREELIDELANLYYKWFNKDEISERVYTIVGDDNKVNK